MKHWPEQLSRVVCWLAAALAAVSLVSCKVCRPLNSDMYVGPARGGAGAPAAGKAAGVTPEKPTKPKAAAGPVKKAEPVAKKAAPADAAILSDGPLAKKRALLMALKNNQALVVERLTPRIARTWEPELWSVFDPVLTGAIGHERVAGEDLRSRGERFNYHSDAVVGEAGLTKLFPTGTQVALGAMTEIGDVSMLDQLVRSRVGLTVTQPLLKGAGTETNLAVVRQARLDALASDYQLRGFVEMFVAEVEQTYWDCMLAKLQIEIFEKVVDVARKRLERTKDRIKAGTISRTEQWAAEGGLARRRERLIDAQSDLKTAKLRLLRAMNPGGNGFWEHDFQLPKPPDVPNETLDVDPATYAEAAMQMRPDLNEARLRVKQGTLEVVRTRNGLLPQLDLFVTWGKSGYAKSFGGSWGDMPGDAHDLVFGVRAAVPLGNHAARAQHKRAKLTHRQAQEALKNMEQLVQQDVRTAYIEVERATAQIEASKVTLSGRERTYRAEVDRHAIGRSTMFQVIRAERNLLESQNTVAQSIIDYLKAFVELHRLTGRLLQLRGIEAAGGEPPGPESSRR